MKMFFQILLLIIIVIALAYLFFYFAENLLSPTTGQDLQNQVCFGQKCFFVELAKTNIEREKGLMQRTELDKSSGMLFIFDKEGIYPFWMKNTLIPLDIIWVDSNNSVVFISQNTQPCRSLICPSIFPTAKAKYVLEINAGLCKENNIKLNDIVNIKIKTN